MIEEDNEITLKYSITTDDKDNSVIVKFKGFESKDQIESFSEYLEEGIPLLLFSSSTMH
jgi:hypothetical protein